jgi:phosphogluconate dehydratase
VIGVDLSTRTAAAPDLKGNGNGVGRELFQVFRDNVGLSADGAGVCI